MPRGRKSYTLETEAALKELKQKKKALEAEIKQKNIAELYDMIQQSGKSLDEVKAMLQ